MRDIVASIVGLDEGLEDREAKGRGVGSQRRDVRVENFQFGRDPDIERPPTVGVACSAAASRCIGLAKEPVQRRYRRRRRI